MDSETCVDVPPDWRIENTEKAKSKVSGENLWRVREDENIVVMSRAVMTIYLHLYIIFRADRVGREPLFTVQGIFPASHFQGKKGTRRAPGFGFSPASRGRCQSRRSLFPEMSIFCKKLESL